MPVTKSAIKKLRRDKKKQKENADFLNKVKKTFKSALKGKKIDSVKSSVSLLDKAVKKKLIHKNKAARLKSRLTKKTIVKAEENVKQAAKSKTAKPARKKSKNK